MRNRKSEASRVFLTFTTLAFSIAASVLAACSPQSNGITSGAASDHIVNGTLATDDDFAVGQLASSTVFIIRSEGDKRALCTGSLIRPNIVLTAGHCAPRGTNAEKMIVWAHALNMDLEQTAKAYPALVVGVIANPGFQPDANPNITVAKDDLALLVLDRSLPSQLVKLPNPDEELVLPKAFLAVGYGQADDRHTLPSELKGSGVLRHMVYTTDFKMQDQGDYQGMLTTIVGDSSVCHGDSGGPLFAMVDGISTNLILGITEAGDPQYSGGQGFAFRAAEKSTTPGLMDKFYNLYPMAHDCVGSLNAFVDVRAHVPWILSKVDFIESVMQSPRDAELKLDN